MIHPSIASYRRRLVVLLLVLGAVVCIVRWSGGVWPRVQTLSAGRESLRVERLRLAETRARLLQLGTEGIVDRNRALRAEVERREALAPAGSLESVGGEVRERFAAFAARYGVHAPSFEQLAPQSAGELQIGALRIRAAGGYHAIGTWITEALSQDRLLDIREARLQVVPDTLIRRLREPIASAVPQSPVPVAPSPSGSLAPPGPLELTGANHLDAVVEIVVQWYSLPGDSPATPGGDR